MFPRGEGGKKAILPTNFVFLFFRHYATGAGHKRETNGSVSAVIS